MDAQTDELSVDDRLGSSEDADEEPYAPHAEVNDISSGNARQLAVPIEERSPVGTMHYASTSSPLFCYDSSRSSLDSSSAMFAVNPVEDLSLRSGSACRGFGKSLLGPEGSQHSCRSVGGGAIESLYKSTRGSVSPSSVAQAAAAEASSPRVDALSPMLRASKGVLGSASSLSILGEACRQQGVGGVSKAAEACAEGPSSPSVNRNRSWRGGWWKQSQGGKTEVHEFGEGRLHGGVQGGDWVGADGKKLGSLLASKSSSNLRGRGEDSGSARSGSRFFFMELPSRPSALSLLQRKERRKKISRHMSQGGSLPLISSDPAGSSIPGALDSCQAGQGPSATAPDNPNPCQCRPEHASSSVASPSSTSQNGELVAPKRRQPKSSSLTRFWISGSPLGKGGYQGGGEREDGTLPTGGGLGILASPLGFRASSFRSMCSISSSASTWQAFDGAVSSRRWEDDISGSTSARWSTGIPEHVLKGSKAGSVHDDAGDSSMQGFQHIMQQQQQQQIQHVHQEQQEQEQHQQRQLEQPVKPPQHPQQQQQPPKVVQRQQLQPQQQQQQQQQQRVVTRQQQTMPKSSPSGNQRSPSLTNYRLAQGSGLASVSQQPQQLLGKALRMAKGKLQPAPDSPLDILVAQRGAMKEHLGKFLLDAHKLEVGDVIATGSSGEVRRGRYERQDVAIKILKADGDCHRDAAPHLGLRAQGGRSANVLMVRAEFRREVVALMRSSGSCEQLLPFVGVSVDLRQRLCIVTRYMPGGTLYDLLLRSRRASVAAAAAKGKALIVETLALPLPQLLDIATDVARGMLYLHEHGIMHRDLKSGNVFLEADGHKAVVGDLGVARLKGERGEMTKEVGTYRWMAPEAFGTSAWPVTSKSDVYSFAILLWEMVTGDIPYDGYSPVQAAVAVALSGLRPTIPRCCPRELAMLIMECWDKDPQRRPVFLDIAKRLEKMSEAKGGKAE